MLANRRIGDMSSALPDSQTHMTFAVMKAGGCPTVVISQSNTALTSSPTNAKLPGLASP
jgi:hypothetical protein